MPVSEDADPNPIHIPPTLPFVLKQYAKAAIRTQPYDLLRWSATYFRALANGEVPPSKIRMEYDVYDTPSGLTPGYLRLLVKQLGTSGKVRTSDLYEKWTGVCLNGNCLMEMLKIGGFEDEVDWRCFLGIAAGHLTESLSETMNLLCHLLTAEPAGGPPTVPCQTFTELYAYLARLDCGEPVGEEDDGARRLDKTSSGETRPDDEAGTSTEGPLESSGGSETKARSSPGNPHVPGIGPAIPEVQIQATIAYMQYWAAKQRGFVMPRNMDNYHRPKVDDEASEREVYEPAAQLAG